MERVVGQPLTSAETKKRTRPTERGRQGRRPGSFTLLKTQEKDIAKGIRWVPQLISHRQIRHRN
ncbi:hypothetical protein SAMN05216417_10747 [Nitrosospira multiformis]|uniref:Uncharacterized protein n=1 Tax=Nitrosospira multiformis TaxID=1231 RepID=A0A1I7H6B5_9PROT|nr:hypothetical protein SAMN05216417_10747 [Nitrosospira multiformis]